MYKLKKEYFDQKVVVYTPSNKVIKLDNATQEQFAEVFKIKGNEKFISKGKKETEEVINEPKDELNNTVVYTEADINNAIAGNDYNVIVTVVKELGLFNGQGRPSKSDAIKLLETFLEGNK